MPFIIRSPESFYNAASTLTRATAMARVMVGDYAHHLRDADCTPRGYGQVNYLMTDAKLLFPRVKAIYASPLRRSLFLAVHLGVWLGVPVRASAGLREVRRNISDVGTPAPILSILFPGCGVEQLPERWWNPGAHCAETLECDVCVAARAAAVQDLAAENPDALFVSHGDFLKTLSGSELLCHCEATAYTPPVRS